MTDQDTWDAPTLQLNRLSSLFEIFFKYYDTHSLELLKWNILFNLPEKEERTQSSSHHSPFNEKENIGIFLEKAIIHHTHQTFAFKVGKW